MKKKTATVLYTLTLGILLLWCNGWNVRAQNFREEEKTGQAENAETILDSYYDNFYDRLEIDSIEDDLDEIKQEYGGQAELSFSEIFGLLVEGKVEEAVSKAAEGFYEGILGEIDENRELIIRLTVLVIIAAIFNNYSSILKASYIGDQGFYITYLMIAVLLIQSFTLVYDMAEETVYYLRDIMQCMLPAFYMSIILCGGLTTSHMVNTMFLWMLSFVERILLTVILPGIRIYFLIVLLNQINMKDRFSKLAGLLKQGIQFLLKGIVTGIIGLNIMKSMLVPVYDNAKYNVLQKGLSMLPGGASLSGLSTILLGAGVLIKNSIGLAAVIILLVLGSVPLLKMFCFYIVYRIILALVQPISDNRILAGIQGAADSTGILLRATSTSIILFVLSIAIVILTTNVRLYTG